MTINPLQQLGEHGQSVWLDFISRELVTTDQLQTLIDNDNVTGMTSNPTIFEKAIGQGTDYDPQIHELLEQGVRDPEEIFLGLAVSDIRAAADTLLPVYERTGGADGFVSLELFPRVAHDTKASLEMVRDFWKRVDRPNLMIKVPATPEGVPVIEEAIYEGFNINVTLIFALSAHEQVINAYINGLRRRHQEGKSLKETRSVASFFVSRVDTAVDKMLDEKIAAEPGNPKFAILQGKAAIANARLAYELFEKYFRGPDFEELELAGAYVQRPLWASTSAKNPKYRDVVYAEALIGPDTVDTMPPKTIEAFREHGVVAKDTVREDWDGARAVFADLQSIGIDMEDVTNQVRDAGVKLFGDDFEKLLQTIKQKSDRFLGAQV